MLMENLIMSCFDDGDKAIYYGFMIKLNCL